MEHDMGIDESKKIDLMVEFYAKHTESLTTIGKRYKDVWKLKKNVREMFDLTQEEKKLFETKLNDTLKERGIFEETTEEILE